MSKSIKDWQNQFSNNRDLKYWQNQFCQIVSIITIDQFSNDRDLIENLEKFEFNPSNIEKLKSHLEKYEKENNKDELSKDNGLIKALQDICGNYKTGSERKSALESAVNIICAKEIIKVLYKKGDINQRIDQHNRTLLDVIICYDSQGNQTRLNNKTLSFLEKYTKECGGKTSRELEINMDLEQGNNDTPRSVIDVLTATPTSQISFNRGV